MVTVVLAAVAGARRTTTAYDRYLEQVHAAHADVQDLEFTIEAGRVWMLPWQAQPAWQAWQR